MNEAVQTSGTGPVGAVPSLTTLLQLLNEAGERRGPFHCLTLTADGRVRLVWTHHAEEMNLHELEALMRLNAAQPQSKKS